ncbi:MAG: hypothetical protein Kilf2KO_38410 [Rhodospirillales bacterium]
MIVTQPLLSSLIALVIGLLILVMPRLLNFGVAVYLIVIGILGLLSHYGYLGGG